MFYSKRFETEEFRKLVKDTGSELEAISKLAKKTLKSMLNTLSWCSFIYGVVVGISGFILLIFIVAKFKGLG
jgi:hypothetical protein